jgi:UDP-glucose 4-epimerase
MIVVTGAFGFIGVYLIDELVRLGYKVMATGRRKEGSIYFAKKGLHYDILDVADRHTFSKLPTTGVEAVIHLAGYLPANIKNGKAQDYIRINTIGTLNVLDYCKSCGIKKIITTTSYADVQNKWRVTPPILADEPYSYRLTGDHAMYVISKAAASDAVMHYNEVYGLSGIIFRLPMVYGHGPHMVIYQDGKYYKSGLAVFIEKAEAGEYIEIYGDHKAMRDVVYIKDVVQAFVKALVSKDACGIYNISSGVGLTLEDQVLSIIKVFCKYGKKSELVFRPDKPNNIEPFVFDICKAQQDFGFQPAYSFDQMMEDLKHVRDNRQYAELIESRIKVP